MSRMPTLLASVLLSVLTASCGPPPMENPPVVVIGIDGAEWKVIEWLWEQDRLPNLRQIADEGVATHLSTIHHASPVIWTSVATGVKPETHGITDFAIPTSKGDQPVSSTLRRVPALWNMATAAHRSVAVLGWWVTWPAETVNGVLVSDRALSLLDRRVFPDHFTEQLDHIEQRARAEQIEFGGNEATNIQDNVMGRAAVALGAGGFDLLMVYFRSVDITSHFVWKYFEPEGFGITDPDQIADGRRRLGEAYDAVDLAIGEIRRVVGPNATVMVLSDHGFHAMAEEELRVIMDFDAVLEGLGLLQRAAGAVDMSRSKVYTFASPTHTPSKMLRFCRQGREEGGSVTGDDVDEIRRELVAGLAEVTWPGGQSAFTVREPARKERRKGADLVVDVLLGGAAQPLVMRGEPIPDATRGLTRLSGTHGRQTDGIFFASGTSIDPGAELPQINVLDITPTVLFALGLPVAESFDGRVWPELFTTEFRTANPLRTIDTWGEPKDAEGTASVVDQQLIEELAALGYIDR